MNRNFRLLVLLGLLMTSNLLVATSFANTTTDKAVTSITVATLSSELKVFLVSKDAQGKESLVPITSAAPGAVLEYQAIYKNNSKNALKELEFDLPIPNSTELIKDTVFPQKAKASTMVGGTLFADIPLSKVVKDAQNKDKVVLLPMSDYKIVRWSSAELAAGQTTLVKARVIVINKN